ncbi:MAG: long-chain-acyl-CoA synthetase [Syntrophomonadaceae bacterium]|nr:long-chain-acyl-CoA synthetase [Syntrophomonadaceae bacterium]
METASRSPFETIASLAQTQMMSLGSELERQAVTLKERPAIIFEERTVTFEELNALANRYANHFKSLGLQKGDVVALLMENRPEFLIAASGLSKLGVIVSLINNGVRKDVLAHALNICDAKMLIVGHELMEPFLEIREQVHLQEPGYIFVENEGRDLPVPEGIIDLQPLLAAAPDQNPPETTSVTSDDVIVYIYTSGTTGFPKACAVTQKRWLILGNLSEIVGQMTPESVQYMVLPLYHNSGFDIGYSATIISGGAMVLRRKFSARNFWSEVRRHNADLFIYVGELCRYIYNQPPQPDDADNPLKSVIGNGMRGDLMVPFKERFGIQTLIEIYGATEGVGSFLNLAGIPGMCGNLSMLGRRQGEVIKFDLDTDEIIRDENGYAIKCSAGETGLLVCEVNDLNVFAGYVNNPQATTEKLMHNLLQEGDCYFNSGDLVALAEDDYFSFVDRMGDTFRWKSENVSTTQVSNLVNHFGQMEDVNVYGVQVPGMEGRCGMAAIKLLEGETLDWAKLGAFVCEKLPSYARPYFIRLRDTIDATNSFKQVKTQLQKEGFDPSVISDPLYFLDPDQNVYVELTPERYAKIVDHTIKF